GAVVTYTHGNQLISQTRTGGGAHFYLTDGQLSVRQLATAAGAGRGTYTHHALCVLFGSAGSTPNNKRLTGEQIAPHVGFYYLRARYDDQTTGRFITTDPVLGNIFDPVSLHRYLYANANPVNNRDPSGRSWIGVVIFIIALVAVLIAVYLILTQVIKYRER